MLSQITKPKFDDHIPASISTHRNHPPKKYISSFKHRKYPQYRNRKPNYQKLSCILNQSLSHRTAINPTHRRSKKPFHRSSYLPILSLLFVSLTSLSFSSFHHKSNPRHNTVTKATSNQHTASPTNTHQNPVYISVVAPLNQPSHLSSVPWSEVLPHIAQRLQWTDPSYRVRVHDIHALQQDLMEKSDILVAIRIHDIDLTDAVLQAAQNASTFFAIDSHQMLQNLSKIDNMLVPQDGENQPNAFLHTLLSLFSNENSKKKQETIEASKLIKELYSRRTADDFLYCFLVLINSAVRPVPMIANSTKQANAGIKELSCMVSKCGKEIFQCFTDSTCRAGLDCLNGCSFNDQVCSYRCIVSYESPQFQAFSLCILQKHNCLGLTKTEIPALPDPEPMHAFQGRKMTHELAEDIFVGWLKGTTTALVPEGAVREPFSWRVFAGKNAAYDHFPCQYQLFFPGKAKQSFWYQPVFKIITLDGRAVWRERLYRVRRRKEPGTFRLSVLDNGVTSLENWTILDCAKDLEWCVFNYNGAASAAGLSYTGAILTSKSGEWPTEASALERIESALDRAGIKMWELSTVSNKGCGDAPLTPSDVALLSSSLLE